MPSKYFLEVGRVYVTYHLENFHFYQIHNAECRHAQNSRCIIFWFSIIIYINLKFIIPDCMSLKSLIYREIIILVNYLLMKMDPVVAKCYVANCQIVSNVLERIIILLFFAKTLQVKPTIIIIS